MKRCRAQRLNLRKDGEVFYSNSLAVFIKNQDAQDAWYAHLCQTVLEELPTQLAGS
jgi:hypothetical protein